MKAMLLHSFNTRSSHDLPIMHSKGLTLTVVFMLLPLITGEGRERTGDILSLAGDLVDVGKLRPHLAGKRFVLDEIAQAHGYLDSGRAVGKVVVEIR